MLELENINIKNKRVLVRVDFNVPIEQGRVTNAQRITAALPTIKKLIDGDAAVILLSHLGRPNGEINLDSSLEPVVGVLAELLNKPVRFESGWDFSAESGEVVLWENVRFHPGETDNNPAFAKRLAGLGDVFVMDAFGTAHRSHASTVGIIDYISTACAGPLLISEIKAIKQATDNPMKPVIGIIGGAKVSTKLDLLERLLNKLELLIVGGGICNTFLAADNYPVGESLYELDFIPQAKKLLKYNKILLPKDVVVDGGEVKLISDVGSQDKIFDIGPLSASDYAKRILEAGTVLWNGPVGIFEQTTYSQGTQAIAEAINQHQGFSLAGGGDTVAAIDKFNARAGVSYISTGGGAFLSYLEGKPLPVITRLEQHAQTKKN